MAVTRSFPSSVTTPRLRGDRPTRDDGRALVAVIADPGIPETMFPAHLRGSGRTLAFLDRAIRHWDEHGYGVWIARERATGEVVGRVGVMRTTVDGKPAVEVGWFIARDRWGRGYAPELAAAAVEHAFAGLRLPELVSFTLATNRASQSVMRKLGLAYVRDFEHAGLPHVLHRRLRAGEAPE